MAVLRDVREEEWDRLRDALMRPVRPVDMKRIRRVAEQIRRREREPLPAVEKVAGMSEEERRAKHRVEYPCGPVKPRSIPKRIAHRMFSDTGLYRT